MNLGLVSQEELDSILCFDRSLSMLRAVYFDDADATVY